MEVEGIWRDETTCCQLQNFILFVLGFCTFVPPSAAASFLSSSTPIAFADRTDSRTVLQPNDLLGVLYPEPTESREVFSIDGTWNFRLAPEFDPDAGFRDKWYAQQLQKVNGQTN